jgi:hypothetical protein
MSEKPHKRRDFEKINGLGRDLSRRVLITPQTTGKKKAKPR